MSITSFDDESQDFSYLNDSQMNSSEYIAESNIDSEGSSSSIHDMALINNSSLSMNKYLVIIKDPVILARARTILYPKIYISYIYILIYI